MKVMTPSPSSKLSWQISCHCLPPRFSGLGIPDKNKMKTRLKHNVNLFLLKTIFKKKTVKLLIVKDIKICIFHDKIPDK